MLKLVRAYPWVFVVLLALVLFLFGTNIATFYTDWLWFGALAHRRVFLHIYGTRIALFGAFGAASFLLAYFNVWLASRFSPPSGMRVKGNDADFYPVSTDGKPFGRALQNLSGFRRVLDGLLLLGALFFAVLAGLSAQGEWDSFLRFTHPVAFGIRDPQFGRDISLYVFTLPWLRYVQGWLLVVLMLVGGGVTLVYLFQQSINAASGRAYIPPHVRAHLSAIAGLAFLAKAWGYYLDRYDLLYGDGLVTGAGYTDIHARLPMLNLLLGITILAALAVWLNIWRRTIALPVAALALWLAFAGVGIVVPGTVQRLRVKPNEGEREAPFLARSIAATRAAYDVDGVQIQNFPADPNLTSADLQNNRQTLDNIRLWDYEPLLETYPQQQGLRQYYAFPDVDVDRYRLKGGADYQQVLIGVREFASSGLDARARTWPNQHLRYTHGFGAVVSPAGRTTTEGLPQFLLKDIPPAATDPALALTQPRIYYGTSHDPGSYVVVNTSTSEFDYPEDTGSGPVDRDNRYDGAGGVKLTPLAKLAFAVRFAGWTNLMLSSEINAQSRLLFARRVPDRVKRIAPFLQIDHDPYPVIVDGRVEWIQDCYTTSEAYPYAAPLDYGDDLSPGNRINYIRNSVKAVVDAYDGTVTFYVSDETDPVLRAYRRIFPDLFQPASAMPPALRAHRRYPEDLFRIQQHILADYHVRDAGVFYARADSWQMTTAQSSVDNAEAGAAMPPSYVTLRLPGSLNAEFVLLSPFTPRDRQNMVALLVARCDAAHYGERVLYRFPASRTVYGPEQVGKRIRSDSKISPYLSLNDQKGSRVLFGSMLIIPIERSLLYVQPLYVKAQTGDSTDKSGSIPELKQVIVAFENRIAMEPTLPAALADLFGEGASGTPATPATTTPPPATGSTGAKDTAALIREAGDHYDRAQTAQRAGDWATYGAENKALGAILQRLRDGGKAPVSKPVGTTVP